MKEIRKNSKWVTSEDFYLLIGSTTQNPNSKKLALPAGHIITWDEDAPNGNVWFYTELNGVKYRGKRECGTIKNLIKNKSIKLHEMGNGFVIYHGDYLVEIFN